MTTQLNKGAFIGSLFLLTLILSFAFSQPKWTKLGTRSVNWSVDQDVIPVTGAQGSFNAIKITVDKAAVNFGEVKIHFKKGAPQDVKIKKKIPAGGETRVIDIKGKNRIITKVTFWYTTSKPAPRGKAIVNLFGRK